MSDWISVYDRLPEKYVRVLIAARPPANALSIGYIAGNDWGIWWEYALTLEEVDPREDGLVTHWHPLPDPPAPPPDEEQVAA